MSVCCDCWVLSGRDLCVGLITRPEESYWAWCAQGVWPQSFVIGGHDLQSGRRAAGKNKKINVSTCRFSDIAGCFASWATHIFFLFFGVWHNRYGNSVTGWTIQKLSVGTKTFFSSPKCPDSCEVHPVSYLMRTIGSTLESISAGGIWGSGSIPPLPHIPLWQAQKQLGLYVTFPCRLLLTLHTVRC